MTEFVNKWTYVWRISLIFADRIVDENLYSQLLEVVLKECGRGNIAYQTAALESLGKILGSSIYEQDYFDRIYNNLKSIILKVRWCVYSW